MSAASSNLTAATGALALCAVVFAGQVFAQAQDPKNIKHQAAQCFAAGDYECALQGFQEAYRESPQTSLLFNIAMCHKALFHYAESMRAFREFLEKETGRERMRSKAQGAIDELSKLVGVVVVEDAPAGAVITLDGRDVQGEGDPPELILQPGRFSLRVEAKGFRRFETFVNVAAEATVHVQAKLEPEEAEPEPLPPARLETDELSPISVGADEPRPCPAAAPTVRPNRFRLVSAGVSFGMGFAAAAFGGYNLALRETVDVEGARKASGDARDYVEDSAARHTAGGVAGFVAAAVLVTTGVMLLIMEKRTARKINDEK